VSGQRDTPASVSVSELLAAIPDAGAVDEYWRRTCQDMVTVAAAAEYERGQVDGYLLAIADVKAFQHGAVKDAQLERRCWHLCCRRCRLSGHRDMCCDCQERVRATFGQPHPHDYPGTGQRSAA
jgi:hypothetical protein